MAEINNTIINDITRILKEAQESSVSHQKSCFKLKEIFNKAPQDLFLDIITKKIALTLSHKTDSTFVNRLLQFFATFTIALQPKQRQDEECGAFQHIIEFLIAATDHKTKCVCLRSFILIRSIVQYNAENGKTLSDSLRESIVEACLSRTRGKTPVDGKIKKEIILCLTHFQDVEEPDVLSFIVKSITASNFQVRQSAIEAVEVTPDSIGAIIGAIRDINEHVRLSAYTKLSEIGRYLNISQRRQVILTTLCEQSAVVLKYLPTFCDNWLKYHDGNVIQLLYSVRYDGSEKDVYETNVIFETILNHLLKIGDPTEFQSHLPLNEDQLIPIENLNFETSSSWRIYCEFMQENRKTVDIETFLPDFMNFCAYIKAYFLQVFSDNANELHPSKYLELQHNLTQLFQITKLYDVSDVARRNKLTELVTFILEKGDLTLACCETVVENLELIMPNNNDRATFIVEIVSKIRNPDERDDHFIENSARLTELNEALKRLMRDKDEAVRREDFNAADEFMTAINEVKTKIRDCEIQREMGEPEEERENNLELVTVLKYLKIVTAFFNSKKIDTLTPAMKILEANFIFSELGSQYVEVKKLEYQACGKCCLFSESHAKDCVHLFAIPITAFHYGEDVDSELLEICIKIVTDLLLKYGTQLVAEPEDVSDISVHEEDIRGLVGGTSLTEILKSFTELMDNDEEERLRLAAARALCLLVLHERVRSPAILSRLIIKWGNPLSIADGLQEIIGTYWQSYTEKTSLHDSIKEAVLMTIEKVYDAPDSSPLFDINLQDMTKFMLELCKSCNEDYHSELMFKICNKMLNKPRKKINAFYSKMLLWMDLKEEHLGDLKKLCKEFRKKPISAEVAKNVIKFENVLIKKSGKIDDSSGSESNDGENSD